MEEPGGPPAPAPQPDQDTNPGSTGNPSTPAGEPSPGVAAAADSSSTPVPPAKTGGFFSSLFKKRPEQSLPATEAGPSLGQWLPGGAKAEAEPSPPALTFAGVARSRAAARHLAQQQGHGSEPEGRSFAARRRAQSASRDPRQPSAAASERRAASMSRQAERAVTSEARSAERRAAAAGREEERQSRSASRRTPEPQGPPPRARTPRRAGRIRGAPRSSSPGAALRDRGAHGPALLTRHARWWQSSMRSKRPDQVRGGGTPVGVPRPHRLSQVWPAQSSRPSMRAASRGCPPPAPR